MTFLLIGKSRTLRQTRWLTAQHHAAARRGDLLVVNMETGERLTSTGWRPVAPRRGEPIVMLAPRDVEDELDR